MPIHISKCYGPVRYFCDWGDQYMMYGQGYSTWHHLRALSLVMHMVFVKYVRCDLHPKILWS